MGHAPEKLSEHEYQTIKDVLQIARYADSAREIVGWTIDSAKRGLTSDELLLSILWHYANENGADGALLGHHQSDKVHWISKQERETLEQTLTAIRAGDWFGEWLVLQVGIIATGSLPDDCYPTPLKVAASLGACIEEHEERMKAALEVVRKRPDLIQAEMPIYPIREATPEPPAAPEPAQPSATSPATPQRTRKTRKKAGHA